MDDPNVGATINQTGQPDGISTSVPATQVVCYPATRITSSGIWMGQNPFTFTVPALLLQMSVVLIITTVLQTLLKPLKQPSIVSDVLGGIILGPMVFGKGGSFTQLFPDQNSFLLKTLSALGMTYYMFLIGVKIDIRVALKGKKATIIAFGGLVLSWAMMMCVLAIVNPLLAHSMKQGSFYISLAGCLAATPFPGSYNFLSDMKLLNTDIGQISLPVTLLNDFVGWLFFVALDIAKDLGMSFTSLLYYPCANIIVGFFLVFCIRPMMLWIVRNTPEGRPINQSYIVAILLGVSLVGLLSDVLGLSIVEGPLLFGLIIPDGPPLGSVIAEKVETIVKMLLSPIFFSACGQLFDIYSVTDSAAFWAIIGVVVVGKIGKFVGTVLPAIGCKVTLHNALCLGLVVINKGFVDMMIYLRWHLHMVINRQVYTTLVLSLLISMMIEGPLLNYMVLKSKPDKINTWCTIQHCRPNTELRVLTCIRSQVSVPAMIRILEASHPSKANPMCVYVMHLIELLGRATPILKTHKPNENSTLSSSSNAIFAAFRKYEQYIGGNVMIQLLSSVSPFVTMHKDICRVALDKKVSLVLLPFYKQQSVAGNLDMVDRALQIINTHVLNQAPCSVGILVDRSSLGTGTYTGASCGLSAYHIGVLFFGGGDDREALSYASRMAEHPKVTLNVLHFSCNNGYDNMEKQLDNDLIEEFKLNSFAQNERILYCKKTVGDAVDIVTVIRSEESVYDLIVVGRRHETSLELTQGLSIWSENPELGELGDLCCSADFFGGKASVLVMQQQRIASGTAVRDSLKIRIHHFDTSIETKRFLSRKE